MLIGGFQKTTLIDYPGKIAATVFTVGCNFRCSFCHNPGLVKETVNLLTEKEVLNFLLSRRGILEAVCITGGEPTLHDDLENFIYRLKEMGFLVKLDTNGINPAVLRNLIDKEIINYVAMDIKAPWAKYPQITKSRINIDLIKGSALILQGGKVDYEFRSTVMPAFHSQSDIMEMARQVSGAKKYYLQNFRPSLKHVQAGFESEKGFTQAQLDKFLELIKPHFEICEVRNY